ncbi:tRNA-uridine aminocarboxypropyltransferase [Massilia phosphatilytica]
MTNLPSPPRRATCAACLRAQSACICRWVRPLSSRADLLILQHPLEVRNAKNSARLLHLCLGGSRLDVGEAFDPAVLHALLHEGGRVPLLLYPGTPGEAAAPVPDPVSMARPERLRLVVLDATWRKSRKMLYVNPELQRLPRLALHDVPASAYRIRKAHAAHQLSTCWKRPRWPWPSWRATPPHTGLCCRRLTVLCNNKLLFFALEPFLRSAYYTV